MSIWILLEKISIFWRYYRKAKTIYKIHSPHIYEFVTEVLDTKKQYYSFDIIEAERKSLLSSKNNLSFVEMGAGSHVSNRLDSRRGVSEIAKSSLAPPDQTKYLFHLVNKYHRGNALELGTSLGISTLYMMAAKPSITITTLEGNKEVLDLATQIFKKHGFQNYHAVLGNFDETLTETISKYGPFDLIYVDGNHSYEATLRYFQQILPHVIDGAIFIFDDIHWSKGMYEAWEKIIQDKHITTSIEIYDLGFVFIDSKLPKQQITYIDFWKKPWQIGLFAN